MRGAPVGCAMLLAALVLGIAIGLLVPRPSASREPSTKGAPHAFTPIHRMDIPSPAVPDRLWQASPAAPDQRPAEDRAPSSAPTLAPRHQPDPVPVAESKATPGAAVRPRNGLSGQASWFGAPTGTAAAGRPLRAFLGRGWRHDRVQVCGRAGCARLALDDWMGNPRRVVDLNPDAFVRVCGPLTRGVCPVTVTP